MTFVDWDDLHKWALIDKALEFNKPEPVETYSSSPHLYQELRIPAGTKGRLPHAQSAAATQAARAAAKTRTRRADDDVKSAGSRSDAQSAAVDTAQHTGSTHEGTHDGTAHEEHVPGSGTHDGSGNPRRRRRRRGPRPATPSA